MSDDRTPDSERDVAFVARMRSRLAEAAQADRAELVDDTFAASRPVARARTPAWRHVATALAAAAVAAVVTWLALGGAAPRPTAFDGGGGTIAGAGPSVRLDAHGRLAESEIDGERLIFRSGHLVRIERRVDGALHGDVVDLDGAGRVVRIERWRNGELTATQEAP